LARGDAGATSVEYGLLVALIAISIIAGATAIGSKLSASYSSAACSLATTGGGSCTDIPAAAPSATLLAASDWCPASANGTIVCRAVDKMNNLAWTSPDITFATTAALTGTTWNQSTGIGGNGYGVWLRATQTPGFGITSGYTFQVDPGAGSKFVVKVWNSTTTNNVTTRSETTIGSVSFPPGFDPTADNRVSVTMAGNRLNASVNGSVVFSNYDVVAASTSAGKVPPTGTKYGMRTWGQAGINMGNTTVL
jgi:pilus assembly protein Flp/PilA